MNQKNMIYLLLGSLALLLGIRLVFFLQDGTSDFVETLLIGAIFIGSFLMLALLFVYPTNTFKERIKPYARSLVFAGLILILDWLFIIKNNLGYELISLFSTLFVFSLVFIVTMNVSSKRRCVIHRILTYMTVLYLIAQDAYFHIFNDLFSFKELGTLREGIESSETMIQVSWYFFTAIGLLILSEFIVSLMPQMKNPKIPFKRGVFTSLILFLLLNLNATYPVKSARLHTSDHYLYVSMFSKSSFMSKYGSMQLFVRDITKILTPDFNERRANRYVEAYADTYQDIREANDYTGLFEGKNLLYIIGESFDDLVVNETLTPNIYKLKNEGWDFTNHYAPVYPRTTCDAEIIYNTSIIPSIEDGPTCYTYNKNSYQTSLANRFNQEGYTSLAFHNNYKEFYTRDLVYKGLGYDAIYGEHELDLSLSDKRYDSVFFDQAKTLMIDENSPFFSFVLTLSGHSPYADINLAGAKHYDTVDDYYGDTISEELKYYMATQLELDEMIGDLLDYLDSVNLLEDTVIILTTDHYPYTLNQEDYTNFKGIEEDYQKAHAPLYIYHEGITPMKIDKLTTSFDLLPTIMNLFNLEGDYRFYVGHDIFGSKTSYVYYKDYSVFTGDAYYYLEDLTSDTYDDLYLEVNTYYELSKNLLRSDYLRTHS
jgi:phosphoglycerol transferase MdoB-like AlkP superfamily enzyme